MQKLIADTSSRILYHFAHKEMPRIRPNAGHHWIQSADLLSRQILMTALSGRARARTAAADGREVAFALDAVDIGSAHRIL